MQSGDLTEGNIIKKFILFALPLLGGSLFQQLYSTADMLFVGNFLGKNAAAAIGASSILVNCLIRLFTGISVLHNILAPVKKKKCGTVCGCRSYQERLAGLYWKLLQFPVQNQCCSF